MSTDAAIDNRGLDKFQVATARFIDTLYGFLSGNHPTTSIDNARAVCELMTGLTEHLKKSKLLPADISLIYSFKIGPNDQPSDTDLITADMYKGMRARSNYSKHADRDAGSILCFGSKMDLDHLIFNMVVDYETLHCALMEHGLLDRTNEKLYSIRRSFFDEFRGYKKIYYPEYDVPPPGKFSDDFTVDFNYRVLRSAELSRDETECLVPAGTAACVIFSSAFKQLVSKTNDVTAQKMKELGIWPVNTQTNSRITRDPNIINPAASPAPRK